ncbi:MAG: FGGY family carbohydrate kinase [Bacteroidota bacterium]
MSIPVIAIFDIGKTNKKVFLFDEYYQIRFEKSIQLAEIKDEDGFPCEDIHSLTRWIKDSFKELLSLSEYKINAINISAHGASFVHLDESGNPVAPLYNYLKPYPDELKKKFYNTYGGENEFSRITASPVLGNLNSGMQLYWLKQEHPEIFKRIKYSLHLPEYISYLFSGKPASGITSIGCHTNLWDFKENNYHQWVSQEGILEKLAPIHPSNEVVQANLKGHEILSGIGLHDSSAALIPYLKYFTGPFVLLSTGTWSISLNPFNHSPLTSEELEKDCLCYLTYQGKPVKASRQFAGHEHDQGVNLLSQYFNKSKKYYQTICYDDAAIQKLKLNQTDLHNEALTSLGSFEEAYHLLVMTLVEKQKAKTGLVIQDASVKNIFVDGGFSQNKIYMNLLAQAFPKTKVNAASLPQASSLGAALVIHEKWNPLPLPQHLIQTIQYPLPSV